MKFEEILPKLKLGNKIRRKGWSNLDKYYYIEKELIRTNKGKTKNISYEQMNMDDWEVYERKKDWSNYCATTNNRNQCSEEGCIIFPICKIKDTPSTLYAPSDK